MKKAVGYTIIASIFISLFVWAVHRVGLHHAILAFAIVFVVFALIGLAVHLINDHARAS